ncbi:MAG: glycosyltransferase [bacterium]
MSSTDFGKRPFCVGLVLPYLKSRGTEKQALQLARGFLGKGARVVVFVVQGWGLDAMYQAFSEVGARVVDVGPPLHVGEKDARFSRVVALARLVRQLGCDVLLSRAGMTNRIAGYAGRLAFVPATVVISGPVRRRPANNNTFRRLVSSARIAYTYGFPQRVVTVSAEAAVSFSASYPWFSKRVFGIRNGVDVPGLHSHAEPPFVLDTAKFSICYSGSLEMKRKGLDVLIQAIKSVVFERGQLQVSLVLIGTGEDEQRLREMVRDAELGGHVVFAGEQDDPYPIMAQCSAFVLPSRAEGLPNALLEAMALGLCTISADCDTGPREVISDGENGLLVPVNDSKSLANAIVRVLRDGSLRERLGRNGRETVRERFSRQAMIDSYYELLSGLT